MTRTRVAIVGAGLGGPHAARLLRAANVAHVLLEARDRLGGRILTVDEAGRPAEDGFDLGPSWFWPRVQPAIAELVAELGLMAFGQNGEGDVIFERMSREGARRYHGGAEEPLSFRLVGGSGALVRPLARLLGPDARRPRATLFEDWAADPLTATAADPSDGGPPRPIPRPG